MPNTIRIENEPPILGLTFRLFRGKEDYPRIVAVLEGSKHADGIEETYTVEGIARHFEHHENFDRYRDCLIAEVNGSTIGYSNVWWWEEPGLRAYIITVNVVPAWRGKGIRRSMLLYSEGRAREIARGHPAGPRYFQAAAGESEKDWVSLVLSEGYQPVRYGLLMVRPLSLDIPHFPLPQGLEVRSVTPDHYEPIREAVNEAFEDHWGRVHMTEEAFRSKTEEPSFDPHLWQVAWDIEKNEVAGVVLNLIDEKENEEYHRKRGYNGFIAVRRPYRGKGLAKALIARSLGLLVERGMTEAALAVDAENITGALQLYESLGYSATERWTTFRKRME